MREKNKSQIFFYSKILRAIVCLELRIRLER